MISRSNSCFLLPDDQPVSSQSALGYGTTTDGGHEGFESNPSATNVVYDHMSTLIYSLALLKERVHQAELLVRLFASSSSSNDPYFSDHQHSEFQGEPTSMIKNRISSLVQEIVSVSSSMMFTCQQMSLSLDPNLGHTNPEPSSVQHGLSQSIHSIPVLDRERNNNDASEQDEIAGSNTLCDQSMTGWFGGSEDFHNATLSFDTTAAATTTITNADQAAGHFEMIIEMDAADLLAKYTHFCQVCNKGFKRDANLRMHMRAHGDEYKSNAALTNPKKNEPDPLASTSSLKNMARRYSCPQDGCRWNRKHPKFQPLKSMICIKNHYKRSHCPKMYVCKTCNQKEFSVVSDLRTHEKHCGEMKWRCSCGTTFSRKDKLLGHVGLFHGHFPIFENHGFCGAL